MAVGLAVGRSKLEPTSQSSDYAKAMDVGRAVFDGFRDEFGSVRCRDIHLKLFRRHYNLRDPQEWREFVKSSARAKRSGVRRVAARLAVEALS